MLTYQDLMEKREKSAQDKEIMQFVTDAITQHKYSEAFKMAEIADEYDRHKNRTIIQYQKLLYTIKGTVVPDNYSANYKLPSRFFNRFVVQQNQFLLGNGIVWENKETAEKLGNDFDIRLQEAGKMALVGGVSFGFFDMDHLQVFSILEFVPLYDEENGALRAGVRFWQIDSTKPLRATLYEEDGFTDFIWKEGKGEVLKEKRPYKLTIGRSEVDGTEIYDGENYPAFPIVPLYGNPHRQSELIGIREGIDAYDLIKSGFANDLDDASQIYWTITNAGGMDDIDLAEFVERMKTVKAWAGPGEEVPQAHTIDVPYNAREAILARIEKDLYRDYMALNTEDIAAGAVTATQIKAAYEPMTNKADQYEYCVHDFIIGILAVAGLEDEPTFTRSILINVSEEVQTVLQAAEFLTEDYVTRKILTILGDGDSADEMIEDLAAENIGSFDEEDEPGLGPEDEIGEDEIRSEFEDDGTEEEDAETDEILAMLDDDDDGEDEIEKMIQDLLKELEEDEDE